MVTLYNFGRKVLISCFEALKASYFYLFHLILLVSSFLTYFILLKLYYKIKDSFNEELLSGIY